MVLPARPRLATAALLVVSIAAALAVGELAVRLLRPQFVQGPDPINNPFWRYDAALGWSHRPGASGRFEREEFSHQVSINSAGWRDVERRPEKHPGRFRVAVLGDSFTWGHGVSDEKVFTRLMERLCEGIEVLNFGLSASATDQQRLILRDHAAGYRPDLVLVMITRNDFAALLQSREGSYPKPRFVLEGQDTLRLTNVPVPEVSRAARWHYRIRRRLGLLNMAESFIESLGVDGGDAGAASRATGGGGADALMRALLRAMAEESRAIGARFAAGLVPSNAHTYLDPVPPAERRRHDIIRAIAREAGFPVLDLVPAFRARAIDPVTGARVDLHYRKDQHWNEAGHAVAAVELSRLLQEAGVLPDACVDGPP